MNRKSGFWIALWAVLIVVTGFLAFGSGPGLMGSGPWHGRCQMGEWNNDFQVGGAHGGYGMGPGMLNGSMMGRGYALAPVQPANLTPEQAQKLGALQQETGERNNRLAQQLWAAQEKLNLLQMSEKRDWNGIRTASHALMDVQHQQLDTSIDLQQKTDGLLTESQRQQMASAWRGYGWTGAQ